MKTALAYILMAVITLAINLVALGVVVWVVVQESKSRGSVRPTWNAKQSPAAAWATHGEDSHDCEVRLMPRHEMRQLAWEALGHEEPGAKEAEWLESGLGMDEGDR